MTPAIRPSSKGRLMATEFFRGRALTPKELDMMREQIEIWHDEIREEIKVDPELRGIVARHWPHLLSKLPRE
jgi:hypothetical protein